MIRHVLGIAWHLGGMFLLPFVLGFVAALFFEVSEIADTMWVMLGLSALVIAPAFFFQLVGVALKVGREGRLLRARGRLGLETGLAAVHRHVRVVTPRGWAVLFTGLSFVVCALGAKWASLSVLAVLALLLFYGMVGATSFLSTFLVGTFETGVKRRGSISREMVPAVVLSGEPAEERFTFRRVPVPPGFYLLVEDVLPARLGTTSRYAVGAGARREELLVGGRLRITPRGLYQLGPAEVYYQDILGLTRISLASLATAELKVLPRFRALEIKEPPRSRLQAPDVITRPHRFATEDHFRFREYVSGDDTRRIHWKLSIRTGHLTLRQPETREVSTRTVLIALDTYLPAGRMLEDAVGVEEVLDRLVETFLALAKELVERGDRVSIVAVARRPDGAGLGVETIVCARGGHQRWQDLGARVVWQGQYDLPQILDAVGKGVNGIVVSSRFQAPPPAVAEGQSLTWVYLPPEEALGSSDPTLLQVLAGTKVNAASWLFRLPYLAGSDENAFTAQLRTVSFHMARLAARRRLRAIAKVNGQRTMQALVARGDAVYRLEPGVGSHRLVGLAGGGLSRGAA
ncbi:MAG: DUF58 domain-containing protein [Pseudomonadota bacterium]|nr:DUF58 domain-containing protein [Pseudomonadota bacterium]